MHLLDTEVIWALRGASRGDGDPALSGWIAAQPRGGLCISAIALAELGTLAVLAEKKDRAGAAAIRRWIDGPVIAAFSGHILAVNEAVTRRAAALGYANLRDGLLAATALESSLTLATRTPAVFRSGKVRTVDPWAYAPRPESDVGDWRDATRGGPVWLRNLFARG